MPVRCHGPKQVTKTTIYRLVILRQVRMLMQFKIASQPMLTSSYFILATPHTPLVFFIDSKCCLKLPTLDKIRHWFLIHLKLSLAPYQFVSSSTNCVSSPCKPCHISTMARIVCHLLISPATSPSWLFLFHVPSCLEIKRIHMTEH